MLQREKLESQPVMVGEKAYKLHSEAIKVDLPFVNWAWNRPTRVEEINQLVASEEGQEGETVPIVDQTRWMAWGMVALAIFFGVVGGVIWMIKMWRQKNNDGR